MPARTTKARRKSTGKRGTVSSVQWYDRALSGEEIRTIASSPSAEARTARPSRGGSAKPTSVHYSLPMVSYFGLTLEEATSIVLPMLASIFSTGGSISASVEPSRAAFLSNEAIRSNITIAQSTPSRSSRR